MNNCMFVNRNMVIPNILPMNCIRIASLQPEQLQPKEECPGVDFAKISYTHPILNQKVPQVPLDKLITMLEKQGKTYSIEGCEMGNVAVVIKNKQGKEVKRIFYDNGDFSKWNCYEDTQYTNGKKRKSIGVNSDGKIFNIANYYQSREIPQSRFTKSGITYDTTPDEYLKYLKKNKIQYKFILHNEERENQSIHIEEYDKNGKLAKDNCWYYSPNKSDTHHMIFGQTSFDYNGNEIQHISFFNNEETEVCKYFDH